MLAVLEWLVFELCRRTGTAFTDEGHGHRKMRFIRMMFRTSRDYGKMWAGQTAPFCLEFNGRGCASCGVQGLSAWPRTKWSCPLGCFAVHRRLWQFVWRISRMKKAPFGAFSYPDAISVPDLQSCQACHPTLQHQEGSLRSVMFGQISASSALSSMKFSMPAGTSSSEKMA